MNLDNETNIESDSGSVGASSSGAMARLSRFDATRNLPDSVLRQVLARASLAPSPFDLQPWRYLIVREKRNRERLRGCAFNLPDLSEAPVAVIVLSYHHPHRSHLNAVLKVQGEGGRLIPERVAEIRGRAIATMEHRARPALWALRWGMVASSFLVQAARELGMTSILIDAFDSQAVRNDFGIPADHTICALVALGYPMPEPEPPDPTMDLDELSYGEHFGQPWKLSEAAEDPDEL